MKNRRRDLEDSVDAIAGVDGLPQIQLRLTHAGTPKAFGLSMFHSLTMRGSLSPYPFCNIAISRRRPNVQSSAGKFRDTKPERDARPIEQR